MTNDFLQNVKRRLPLTVFVYGSNYNLLKHFALASRDAPRCDQTPSQSLGIGVNLIPTKNVLLIREVREFCTSSTAGLSRDNNGC